MFNLEQEITKWRQQMAAGGIKAGEALNELESHLRDDVEQRMQAGVGTREAFISAIQRIGNADALRSEYGKVRIIQPSRQSLWFATLAIGMGILLIIFCFCNFVIRPVAAKSNAQYLQWLGLQPIAQTTQPSLFLACMWTLEIVAGLAMPLGLLFLAYTSKVNYKKILRLRPGMMVINFLLAALLTSPEIMTQVLTFAILQLLCEGSLWFARCKERKAVKTA